MRYFTTCRLFHLLPVILPGLLLAGCATTVNVDYDEKADFSTLHSFRVEAEPVKRPEDERVDTPFVYQRIAAAIEEKLTAKGLKKNEIAPDMAVTFQLKVKTEVEGSGSRFSFGVGTFSRGSSIGMGYGFPVGDVQSYEKGFLTIDFLSPLDRSLLWRGSHSRRLDDGMTPEKSKKVIKAIVDEILDEYPPGKKK